MTAGLIEKSFLDLCEQEEWEIIIASIPNKILSWDFDEKNTRGYNGLALCCKNGKLNVIKHIFCCKEFNYKKINWNGNSLILVAARYGRLEILKWLLVKNESSIAERTKQGNSCMLTAACHGRLNILKWLARNGYSLGQKNNYGDSCTLLAAYNGHLETLKWLHYNGYSIKDRNDDDGSCVLLAAGNGHFEMLKWLINKGASIKDVNKHGESCVLVAARNGKKEIMSWLLKNGSSIKETDKNNNSCALFAAANGKLHILQELLHQGYPIDDRNINGDSLVLLASKIGNLETLKWLFSKGFSLKDKNKNGDTCLTLAARKGHVETVKWLLENNGPLDNTEKNVEMIQLQMIENTIQQALSNLKANNNCELKQEHPPNPFENWNQFHHSINEKKERINLKLQEAKLINDRVQSLEKEQNEIDIKIQQLQTRKQKNEEKLAKYKKTREECAINDKNLGIMQQNHVLLQNMCTNVSILCENENKMNKEIEELFNQKTFENFDCNDIAKLLWKMDLSKYQQVFLDENVNGEFCNLISIMNDDWLIWKQMGIEKQDICKIRYYFEMMKSPRYSDTFSLDYSDECCVCSHNTPEKTILLLKKYNLNVPSNLILERNLCSPELTFTSLWADILGKDIISPDGRKIMTEIIKWKNIHEEHLKRLGNHGAKRMLEPSVEENPLKKQKIIHENFL